MSGARSDFIVVSPSSQMFEASQSCPKFSVALIYHILLSFRVDLNSARIVSVLLLRSCRKNSCSEARGSGIRCSPLTDTAPAVG
jgi:hypothetical protein